MWNMIFPHVSIRSDPINWSKEKIENRSYFFKPIPNTTARPNRDNNTPPAPAQRAEG